MQLSALQTFLAIVETGSLVRASERLNVTQSTVTARLKTLEDELGQTLLVRQKSGATLTASGLKLKRYAEVMTALWQQAKQETSLPKGIEAVCNIGCDPDLWPLFGERFFSTLRAANPALALSVWPGSGAELSGWLESGVVDVALSWQPGARAGQTVHALPEQDLVLVSTNPDAPLRFDPGYVFVEAGEEFGRNHAAAYADAGVANISFGSPVWGLEFLLREGGTAYLPEGLVEAHLTSGALHRIIAPVFQRGAYLITNDAAVAGWEWLTPAISDLQT